MCYTYEPYRHLRKLWLTYLTCISLPQSPYENDTSQQNEGGELLVQRLCIHLSIHYLLLLIRVMGDAWAYPTSHRARGRDAPETGCKHGHANSTHRSPQAGFENRTFLLTGTNANYCTTVLRTCALVSEKTVISHKEKWRFQRLK